MSTTSDDSRGRDHRDSNLLISADTPPPFSDLLLTVESVNYALDLGNPVSCWCRRAASILTQASVPIDTSHELDAVQRGICEAVNEVDLPQSMVGNILHLSRLFQQLVQELSSRDDHNQAEALAFRYRQVADANLITIPWHAVMDSRGLNKETWTRLDALLANPAELVTKDVRPLPDAISTAALS